MKTIISGKTLPTPAQLKKMPAEKARYWKNRTLAAQGRFTTNKRVIQFLAAQKPADLPDPMTRQVRRQLERRVNKMPLSMETEAWHKARGYGKVSPRKRRRAA